MEIIAKGQKDLSREVRDAQLCTGCGACVGLCPYHAVHRDQVVSLHDCDLQKGRCYAFCPRTPTDLQAMRARLFDQQYFTPQIGPLREYLIVRAASEAVRRGAQHGGTVTALMGLALKEGMIDVAVLSEKTDDLVRSGADCASPQEVRKHGKVGFVSAAMVAAFNRAAQGKAEKIGVVATPCQAFALAKMRMKPIPEKDSGIDKLNLVVGLFCGWTLSWRKFTALLEARVGLENVTGMDIPAGKKQVSIFTPSGPVAISWEEMDPLVREACRYCIDTTAEFADISIGSARLPGAWEQMRSWNQLIVRTKRAEELVALARKKKILEFRDVPAGGPG